LILLSQKASLFWNQMESSPVLILKKLQKQLIAAKTIDPYIEKFGKLNGLIIHTRSFPGWDSFGSFITHMKFVKEHHTKVARIAFVTDSPIGSIAEKITDHFIKAEIKHFSFDEIEASKHWIEFGVTQ